MKDELSPVFKLKPPSRKTERGELIRFFANILSRHMKPMAVRLSHYSLDQLYALKSTFTDRLVRNGHEAAEKYFWWVTKTK